VNMSKVSDCNAYAFCVSVLLYLWLINDAVSGSDCTATKI
jgi:hypothetical protein